MNEVMQSGPLSLAPDPGTVLAAGIELAESGSGSTERQYRALLEALPAAVYTTDAAGRITFYNQACVELSGRRPRLDTDEWCVTWRLAWPDGTPLPHDQCPMAMALKENRPIRGMEAVAIRPDGTSVPILPYPTPLHDASGMLVGAVNMLVDISHRKEAETRQRILFAELNHRVKNNLQILHSLLKAAQRDARRPEAGTVIADALQRLGVMAAAHTVLYEANDAVEYDAKHFLQVVCASSGQILGRQIAVDCGSGCGKLPNDTAVPLTLILNELLTNAAKHGGGGAARVALNKHGKSLELSVEDDGPGFELKAARQRSRGLGLVSGLAQQLGGTLEVRKGKGARCVIRFPEQAMAR